MIRINLLTVERKAAKLSTVSSFQAGHKLVVGCTAILLITALFVGWRYFALDRESKQLDKDIVDSQQETLRLRSLIQQVQQFEQQKAQLQQRVQLIEQLRKGQTGPVHMLDEISRALPPLVADRRHVGAPRRRRTGITSSRDRRSSSPAAITTSCPTSCT